MSSHRALALGLTALLPLAVPGQSVRITGATSVRYIELRPFIRDSVPAGAAGGSELLRQLPDGRVVRCIPGDAFCRDVRPGSAISTIPAIHDIDVTAWGFGQGIRVVAQLRARSALGGNHDLWPQGDDAFDVQSLYGELTRDRWRLRAGRQWKVSGLGYYNFDGVAAVVRPVPTAWIEAYAGRSLVRGLNEARTGGALEAIEPLSRPDAGIVVGLDARYRPSTRLALSAMYQVDFRGDRRGLYSELAAANGVFRFGEGAAESSIEMDMAARSVNQARLLVRSPPLGRISLFTEVRRYRPYFELWTIWGAFSPVGFDEARGGVTWAIPSGHITVRSEASYRDYGDADIAEAADPLRTSGWGVGTSIVWSPNASWSVDGSYRVETGFGAARRDGLAGVRRQFGDAVSIGMQALVFQRLYEFRLGEGTVVGLGGEAGVRLNDRLRASGTATAYRHGNSGPSGMDWTQRRASIRLEWAVGREAGGSSVPRGRP